MTYFSPAELVSPDLTPHSFEDLSSQIMGNGGKIVDLDDPKLTHVVVDRLDATRRLKLIERTSKWVRLFRLLDTSTEYCERPKRRRLVIGEWIRDSLEEGTLLDEEGKTNIHQITNSDVLNDIYRIRPLNTWICISLTVEGSTDEHWITQNIIYTCAPSVVEKGIPN